MSHFILSHFWGSLQKSAKPAPGSASRILTYENGQANWEGEDIQQGEPIPEI